MTALLSRVAACLLAAVLSLAVVAAPAHAAPAAPVLMDLRVPLCKLDPRNPGTLLVTFQLGGSNILPVSVVRGVGVVRFDDSPEPVAAFDVDIEVAEDGTIEWHRGMSLEFGEMLPGIASVELGVATLDSGGGVFINELSAGAACRGAEQPEPRPEPVP